MRTAASYSAVVGNHDAHAVQVLPLQVASLLLLTLPWTLPRLLDLQAANPVSVLDGTYIIPDPMTLLQHA